MTKAPRQPRKASVKELDDDAPKKSRRSASVEPGIKRPMSAYLFYVRDASKAFPKGVVATDMIKQVAADWKTLPADRKAHYEQLAAEMKKSVTAQREEALQQRKMVQPPLSAYAAFATDTIRELRAVQPGLKMPEYFKAAGERWRALPAAEKERHKAAAAAARVAWLAKQAAAA